MKFKVGDMVKVLEDRPYGSDLVKDVIVEIKQVNIKENDYTVTGDWFLREESIELVLDNETASVKVKKLDKNAILPSQGKPGDAGYDLTAVSRYWDQENEVMVYNTGLSFEIPEGYVGLIFPRSSVFKINQTLTNCIGVIDSGYRGEVKAMFRNTELIARRTYQPGERIMQMVIMKLPKVKFEEVTELSESDRAEDGFGSTGK